MDHIPDDLLDLQSRFVQWRANRKYNREPIPDELRDAGLEMSRRYPPSLLRRVLKIQPCRLMPKAKTHARRSKRQQEEAEKQLATAIDWGRYAELFEYDVNEERLTLTMDE